MYKINLEKGIKLEANMKNTKVVDRPNNTVVIKSKYVYLTIETKYNKSLKQTRPKRVAIGKLIEDNKMTPNNKYYEYCEPNLEEAPDKADSVIIGPYVVFDSIITKYQIDKLLVDIFPDASKILDVSYYIILNETSAMTYFENYAYNHMIYTNKQFSDTTISEMFKKISDKDIDIFLDAWSNINLKKDIYISYDSTNINTVSGNIELAEYGHAKDNEELPQVNISLAYDQDNSIPLFYDTYAGSIIDNTECAAMVERAKRYGYKEVGFILDRGYFSMRNIQYFDRNGYSFIIMTKATTMFVKSVIEEVRYKLRNSSSYYINSYGISGITLKRKINEKDEKKRYFHVYLDDEKGARAKKEILHKFTLMDEELEKKVNHKLTKREQVESYKKYYRLKFDENGYLLNYKRKSEVIDELISSTGMFVIITSVEMSAEEAIDKYRNRDSIEKLFRAEKSYMGFDCFRVHDEERMKAKLFILFISLIIRTDIYNQLKPLYLKDAKNYTVPKALKELEKLYITKLADDKYHQRYLLTAKQKKILKAFEIEENDYKKIANEIADRLT